MKIIFLVVLISTYISFFTFLVFKFNKIFKNDKFDLKFIIVLINFIILFPIAIYLIDNFDLPSLFSAFKNSNSERWFEFVSNYVTTIVGSLISGFILVKITYGQIDRQNKNEIMMFKNNKRIDHKPILKFEKIMLGEMGDLSEYINLFGLSGINIGNTNDSMWFYSIKMRFKNVGLDSSDGLWFTIDSNNSEYKTTSKMNNDDEFIVEKNSVIDLPFYISTSEKTKEKELTINLTIYYGDLLNNHYKKECKIFIKIEADGSIVEQPNVICKKIVYILDEEYEKVLNER